METLFSGRLIVWGHMGKHWVSQEDTEVSTGKVESLCEKAVLEVSLLGDRSFKR